MSKYIFTSERLGFRNWSDTDLEDMQTISGNKEVMKHFPGVATFQQTSDFIDRMKKMMARLGYCYFPVETLTKKEFIGFIGMAWQEYEADFTPCTDIGWRLHPSYWNMGYATEGAKACLKYAFEELKLERIFSVATSKNFPSIHVMEKIGMSFIRDFRHEKLVDYPALVDCRLYRIDHKEYKHQDE